MSIYQIWHPEIFQGAGKRKNYFEGWYYKLIDNGNKNVLGVIPGISLGLDREESHAFIQIFDATNGKTHYVRYPLDTFSADESRFDIQIRGNHFTQDLMKLDIQNKDICIHTELSFDSIEKYPSSFFSPGIMGPFSFLPFMECHHGVINMRHRIHGSLVLGERAINFEGGEGYIEKDWGRSFPSAWIWAQANHFENRNASFMFSLAKIPFMGKSFKGLIAYLNVDNRFYKFATYNFSRVSKLQLNEKSIDIVLENKKYSLSILIKRAQGYLLMAPSGGRMVRTIEETIDADSSIILQSKNRDILFKGISPKCGLEISENAASLLK